MELNSPILSLLVLPFIVLILWRLAGRRRKGFAFVGAGYLGVGRAKIRKVIFWLLALLVVGLVGLLWSEPEAFLPVRTSSDSAMLQHRVLEVAVDVSGSTDTEIKDEKGQESLTRYEAEREGVFELIRQFPDDRLGLILYSSEPMLGIWPTTEIENQFREILDDNLGDGSNLAQFSGGTQGALALRLAREKVFAVQDYARSKALILVTDFFDSPFALGEEIRDLRKDGIRVYVVGVDVDEKRFESTKQIFSSDSGVRLFHADSAAEMQEAYTLISALEKFSLSFKGAARQKSDLRWLGALVLLGVSAVTFVLMDTLLHRSYIRRGRGGA